MMDVRIHIMCRRRIDELCNMITLINHNTRLLAIKTPLCHAELSGLLQVLFKQINFGRTSKLVQRIQLNLPYAL